MPFSIPTSLARRLADGMVIPAHPLALTNTRQLDERRQRALTRYYLSAGAGGIAVGVHTTQFAIREPQHGLFKPVLELAAETAAEFRQNAPLLIAGICGQTKQAAAEAETAATLGYHAGLVSLSAFAGATEREALEHCLAIAERIPLFGFYLQPAVGGRILSAEFWRQFAQIPNVVAIKISPFNRYQTIDVVRGVIESGRGEEIALLTGNDDAIVSDLLTEFQIPHNGTIHRKRIVGGLLGHWAFWTHQAVTLLERCHAEYASGAITPSLLTLGAQTTEANAAFFDAANRFAGCIPGIHEALRRSGLLANRFCLDPHEELSAGQLREINRIYQLYPHLTDAPFVNEHLDDWLR
ncbi:MAG: dihydrodipicolinate synthase family protein [Armatimonadetes bacterium]|nr:dihydrodipicolinate synthase family protein [Armatimonadota bacterium]